ncbi:MAG: hypothetical protein IPI57_14950 [Candidatus Competibacteraceae bacterium]|nr:hypothetical protein [Candidatus Competibacteraceae bacterium]MBK8964139.1 hypothetical protein [Candidatus Competibacteraceae bacterium]
MPRPFAMRLFDGWLEQNRPRFHRPPIVVERRQRSRVFRFAGVALSVWGSVCDGGAITVRVGHAGTTWDFLADFDLSPARLAPGGYVCRLCVSRKNLK